MASERKSTDAFEAALKRELQTALPLNGADCPAPEVLAAYYDRSLTRSERTRVDSHLLSCVRCQTMVASIARADDRTPAPETARGIFWITRILAPVAVVGVVIAVAIGIRTHERPTPEVIALASPAFSFKPEIAQPAPAAPEAAAPVQRDLTIPSAPPAPAIGESPRAKTSAPHRKTATMKLASPAGASSVPSRSEASHAASASDMSNAPNAVVAGGSELAEQSARSEIGEEKSSSPLAANSNPVPSEAPSTLQAQTASAPAAAALKAPSLSARSVVSTASRTNQISSPDGSVQWRFGSGGTIMRSGNSTPWLAIRSGITTDLLAAAAPSDDVCWVVGKSGTIVRTLDSGAHWQIINPPSRDTFNTVSATDSNNAAVFMMNGHSYATHDGGVTWVAQ